jgi:hypothetical protein
MWNTDNWCSALFRPSQGELFKTICTGLRHLEKLPLWCLEHFKLVQSAQEKVFIEPTATVDFKGF